MTTQTAEKPVNRAVIRLALAHLKRLQRHRAAYEEEVRDWYEKGEGRSPNWRTDIDEHGEVYQWNAGGQGYRFPHCIHGSSLWTDYDNICGPCEDSFTDREIALHLAHNDWHEWRRRMDVVKQHAHVPDHIRDELMAWALDALKILERK